MNEVDYKKIKVLAELLDKQFNLFGIKFGLDPIIGLIPVVGDAIGLALGLAIIFMTWHVRMTFADRMMMILNVVLDFGLGLIPLPFVELALDVFYKSNMQNLKILEKYRGQLKTNEKVIDGEVID